MGYLIPRSEASADRVTAPLDTAVPLSGRARDDCSRSSLLCWGLGSPCRLAMPSTTPNRTRVALPSPRHLSVLAEVTAGLQRAQPGGFDLMSYPFVRAATQSVRSQTSAGALIVPPSGAVTLVTAGAGASCSSRQSRPR